jgi:hypothetical protein
MIALHLTASGVRYVEQRCTAIRLIAMALLLGCLSVMTNAQAQSSAATTAAEKRDAEQYSAYSAYLEHLLSASHFLQEGSVHFILAGAASSADFDIDWVFRAPDLDQVFQAGTQRADTRADFRRNAAKPLILKPAFGLPSRATYELARPEQSDANATVDDSLVTTVRVVLSPAGFNEAFTEALFQVKFSIDSPQCVGGDYVLMQKVGAAWIAAQDSTKASCR